MAANDVLPVQNSTTYPYGAGFVCGSCGAWVVYGATHQCVWKMPHQNLLPMPAMHTCRDCGCWVPDNEMHRVTHEHGGHTTTATVYCEHHCPQCDEP